MKKLVIMLLMFTAFALSGFAQQTKPLRGTAEYYLQEPDRYLDKSVTLYIIMVEQSKAPAPEGYESFFAYTTSPAGNGTRGGAIVVYVREMRAKQFAKKLKEGWIVNGKPQTSAISGKFIKSIDGKGYAVKMN